MILTTRPLTDRLWLRPPDKRVRSQFTASYSDTLTLLQREVYALQQEGMPDPVLMMYGATQSGEQYTGYRALTVGPSTQSASREVLWASLSVALGVSVEALQQYERQGRLRSVALRIAHPDRGGTAQTWHNVRELLAALAGDPS